MSNRDFEMATRTRTQSYRGRKDSSLALYYLWRIGEVMTHHRESFERVYALTEAVAPAHLIRESGEAEVDRFLIKKDISFSGLSRMSRTQDAYHRGVPFGQAKPVLEALLAGGEIVEVQVEGWKAGALRARQRRGAAARTDRRARAGGVGAAGDDHDRRGGLPRAARPGQRARAGQALFGFDYVWEVYKPEHQRKFGYYTLPVLWGDRLVARFDSSSTGRPTRSWSSACGWRIRPWAAMTGFAQALARGFARFPTFLGAGAVDAAAVREPLLRSHDRRLHLACLLRFHWKEESGFA